MKKEILNLLKEIVISILIVIAIVLLVSIIFYNKISLNSQIPEVEKYEISKEMNEVLSENQEIKEAQDVTTTYSINSSELKKYENTKEYNKGKSNPFAAVEFTDKETPGNEDSEKQNNNKITIKNKIETQNFYADDGTK